MHTPTVKRVLGFTFIVLLVMAILTGRGTGNTKSTSGRFDLSRSTTSFLVFTSLFLALLIGVPSGILLSRPVARGFAEHAMQIFNVGNTLPPLAVLALAMIILGIGDIPAIVALFLASLLPIVRNTYAGLNAVPASLKEAAKGIGMTRWQRLYRGIA